MKTSFARGFRFARCARHRIIARFATAWAVLLIASSMVGAVTPLRALLAMTEMAATAAHAHPPVIDIEKSAPHADGCLCCNDEGCACLLQGAWALPIGPAIIVASETSTEIAQFSASGPSSAPRSPPLRPPIV